MQGEPERSQRPGLDTDSPGGPAFSPAHRLGCLFRKEFYSIIPFYLLCLIPLASLLAYACRTLLDPLIQRHLPEWRFPIAPPWSWALFLVILTASGTWLLWIYSYLILEGEGGPCPPFTEKTRRLVTCGPYRHVRHPSILAKLLGVTGLGVAFGSLSFILIAVPLLLAASIILNRRFQEPPLVEKFGEEYLEYMRRTPAIIPCLKSLTGAGGKEGK
jgi:protein-S-isoprenylcysteine O-methyltransferase Ste14